jgi:O-antigen biosynthesis protein
MLVSAIMPTGDREALAPLALDCFLRQKWEDKELIVLDDGAKPMEALFVGIDQVRYLRLSRKATLGEKRNLGVAEARGDVVMHWDDDDWSAPGRMWDQVHRLIESRKSVTGYHQILYWDERHLAAFRYTYLGVGPYSVGTSQCYRREYALLHPFPDKSYGEDTEFSHTAAAAGQLTSAGAGALMVARAHAQSTARPLLGGRSFPRVELSEIPVEFFADREWQSASACTDLPQRH